MNTKNQKRATAVFEGKFGKIKSGAKSGTPQPNKAKIEARYSANNRKAMTGAPAA